MSGSKSLILLLALTILSPAIADDAQPQKKQQAVENKADKSKASQEKRRQAAKARATRVQNMTPEQRAKMMANMEKRLKTRFQKADQDGDGQLAAKEYLAMRKLPENAKRAEKTRERLLAEFAKFDADKNETISLKEFVAMQVKKQSAAVEKAEKTAQDAKAGAPKKAPRKQGREKKKQDGAKAKEAADTGSADSPS